MVVNRATDYEGMPCLGSSARAQPQRRVAEEACIFHFVRLKHAEELRQLNLTSLRSPITEAWLLGSSFFALTPEGVWLGPSLAHEGVWLGPSSRSAPSSTPEGSPVLLSAAARPVPTRETLPAYTFTGASFRSYVRYGLDRSRLVPSRHAFRLLPQPAVLPVGGHD